MSTSIRLRLAFGLVPCAAFLSLVTPSHALLGGTLVDDEGSGFVSLHGSTATCSGTLIAEDVILAGGAVSTPGVALGRCFSDPEILHGDLAGFFMGSEDSDRNPIREIYPHPTLNASLVRLTKGLPTNRPGVPYELFPLRSAELAGRPLTCFGYGSRTTSELMYGTRLTSGVFNVANVNGHTLMIQSAVSFSAIDQGGGCIVAHEGRQLLAGVIGTTNANPTSVDALRSFVTAFRTWHQISSADGDLCVDIPSASTAYGQGAQSYACNGGANQSWSMRPVSGGVEIRAKHSNLCLTVGNNSQIVQATCGGDITNPHPRSLPRTRLATQTWRLTTSPGGITIENAAKAGLCLDRANPRQQMLVTCNKTSRTQLWRIDATTLDNRDHRLAAPDSCIAVKDGPRNGAKLSSDACSGKDLQEWRFERAESPYFRVQARDSRYARCMDVSGANTQANAVLHEWDCVANANNQRWRIEWQPNGTYALRAKHSNLCATRTPSEIQQQPCDANNGKQTWSLE